MQYQGLPLLLVMSRYGRPGFAQSGAMEVVTLEPPMTAAAAAATSSTADARATTSVVPSLLYPVGNPVLNNIDSLSVNYVSPWPVVDLVVLCGATTEDTDTFSFKAENRRRLLLHVVLQGLTGVQSRKMALTTFRLYSSHSTLHNTRYTVI